MKRNDLPRFRIWHSPIIGFRQDVLVKGGTYKLEIPDDTSVLWKEGNFQTFYTKIYVQKICKEYVCKRAGEPLVLIIKQ